jgi:nicotinate-nucleotide pyrophosphorylase (carboxylating)
VAAARAGAPSQLRLQVEVESEAQAADAIAAPAGRLLLDNQSPAQLRRLATRFRDQAVLEASGGITLANVREIAETGVQRISIGALTHSAPNADLALELCAQEPG